ncbi:MAG: hypothetical protein U1C51_02675 [Candidatus Izemoplasmatales bacterium]|nr:hypothetical protein [Candidatus Izemoplasmatales bacterium]
MHTYEVTIILKGNKRITDTVKASTKQNAKTVMETRYPGANVKTPKRID